jgi:hypothetical protein
MRCVPHRDVGLSLSDDDLMVTRLIESHARRKASERGTLLGKHTFDSPHPYACISFAYSLVCVPPIFCLSGLPVRRTS